MEHAANRSAGGALTTPHPTATQPQSARTPSGPRRLIGLVSGAAAALAMLAFPAPEGMPAEAWRVAAVTILMATWWVWEDRKSACRERV